MVPKIQTDIDNDLKLLITAILGFQEADEEFRICERYVVSNIKHHRFLSINSHETKKLIDSMKAKFQIYGKYDVSREFNSLIDTFLTYNFDGYSQYDFQWTLLSFILNLSTESDKSNVACLYINPNQTNGVNSSQDNSTEDINWSEYLKEGQDDFFCNYASNSDSEWSENEGEPESPEENPIPTETPADIDKSLTKYLPKPVDTFNETIESRKWLDLNIENTWWNDITWHECKVESKFPHAHLCDIYNQNLPNNTKVIATIREYQVCREVLWMLHLPMEMVVFEKKSENIFYVRKNLSIPSLTPLAFNQAFSSFCPYFSMVKGIQSFDEQLCSVYKMLNLPPLTYEAYNAVIKQYLHDIRLNLVELERDIMRQGGITTFLLLSKNLARELSRIKILHGIHESVFHECNLPSNWEKSLRLLANLYREIESSTSAERTNICASLYLSSLRVYLNIIDTWLSEGRLEDSRDEFLIARMSQDIKPDEQQTTKFLVRPITREILDPIMNKLFKKVRDMGRSIELLVTLDRISDMWKINSDQCRVPLNDEFIDQVLVELSNYSQNISDELDANIPTENSVIPSRNSDDLEDNIRQQIMRINNPFLMKVFGNYLPPMGISLDAIDGKSDKQSSQWGINVFQRLQKISPFILPFRKVLENVLEKILNRRYSCASKLVKNILVHEYKLEHHLKLMRSIYMMEHGHVMKKFYQHMFREIESNTCWINPYDLTNVLEEVLSDEWRDSSSHNNWSISVEDHCTRQVLKAVDKTTLHYSIDWPVNMVLSEEVLSKYNDIFRFQLKLKWALWSLENLRFSALEGNERDMSDLIHHFNARRLESLRFWLLHAVGSIHTYLSGQVLQSLGFIFDQQLAQTNNLDDIIQVHNEYLDKVHEHCLQTPQFTDIMVTINNLLGMCGHLRDRWQRGVKQLLPAELDLMESSYTKYHTYLALALHNAVQHKDADYYNFNFQFSLMRNLLAEVAHQSYPPSGIPIPNQPLVQVQNLFWSERQGDEKLPNNLCLDEYDRTFLYLWRQSSNNPMAFNLSHLSLTEKFSNLFTENYR